MNDGLLPDGQNSPRLLGITAGMRHLDGGTCNKCHRPAATLVAGKCTECITPADLKNDKTGGCGPHCCHSHHR